MKWIDAAAVESVTGSPALVDQRQPGHAKRFPEPAHVVVCPATFNSVNKLAAGIMDTYAAGIMCEALASHTPLTSCLWSARGCGTTQSGSRTSRRWPPSV
jgi:phosphopantothenoylcysteine decarboxylase